MVKVYDQNKKSHLKKIKFLTKKKKE